MGAEESRKLRHPLLQYQRFQRDCYVKDTREGTSHQKMGQGVVLVTEPHAELNAGFVGLFASKHPAIFDWAQWNADTKYLNERDFEGCCSQTAGILTRAYWTLVSQYLCRRLTSHELSPEASKAWIQTGLALSPLFGTVAQYSIDVIIAWALIGEGIIPSSRGAVATARTPAMHWRTLRSKGTESDGMGQSLLRARRSSVPPILTRDCANIYPAWGSHVPKYRYTYQCPTASYSSRLWRCESPHGICPPDTATARLDTDGFCAGGN